MKLKMSVLAVLLVAFAISFSTVTPATPNPKAAARTASQPGATVAPAAAVPQDHPEIRDALAALRRARAHLQDARHDYHGHRADALRATDEAIRQLEICLKFD